MAATGFYADDEISWAAVGVLSYLAHGRVERVDAADLVALAARCNARWHPSDRGDFDSAWNELLAVGYAIPDGDGWLIRQSCERGGE